MAEFGSNLKNIWMRGMEAIGNTASNIASNTRFKVDEMNLVNRRGEILKDFGAKAYALWQKGAHFPEELEEQLQELGKIDEQLNDLRAEHFAGIKPQGEKSSSEVPPETEAEDEECVNREENGEEPEYASETPEPEMPGDSREDIEDADRPAEPVVQAEPNEPKIPVIHVETFEEAEPAVSPVSSAINELFERIPSADEAAEKVDRAIDSLGEDLKKYSDSLDEKLEDLSRRINSDQET